MKGFLWLSTLATAFAAAPAAEAAPSTPLSPAVAQQFAVCAAQKYEGAELLATQPGSDEEADVLAEFARRGCAASAKDSQLLRGALAEQLFKVDFGSIGARPKRETIEVFAFDAEELASMDAASQKRVYLTSFGSCVAAADSTRSAGLLQTAAGSADEAGVISELNPALSPCLSEGERLDLGKAELRGLLAEGVYRLALAQTVDGAVVVTGTRDQSQSVTCKNIDMTGSHFKRQVCLTAAQWKDHDRQWEYKKREIQRRAELREVMQTLMERQAREAGAAAR
jgi:hypothetical protein